MSDISPTLGELLEKVKRMSSSRSAHLRRGDIRDGTVYAPTDAIRAAVQVALITARPLLISGPPGCGKSSLAGFVARELGFSYFEFVVTDESTPQDLLWSVDAIRRLNDAQLTRLGRGQASVTNYLEPGPLWWALDPESAARRGARQGDVQAQLLEPPSQLPGYEPTANGSVLLIDEIDKAESSFCNGLLVPLGSRQFYIPAIDLLVRNGVHRAEESPLVIITTNNERDLPDAFIRRCVVLPISGPDKDRLIEIATLHFSELTQNADLMARAKTLAPRFAAGSTEHTNASTAEFLDLVRVLVTLNANIDSEAWQLIESLVVEKSSVRRSAFSSW